MSPVVIRWVIIFTQLLSASRNVSPEQLNVTTLRVVTLTCNDKFDPEQTFTTINDLVKQVCSNSYILMLDALQYALQFRLEAQVTKLPINYNEQTSKYEEGAVLHLLSGKADFALATVSHQQRTYQVVDFNLAVDSIQGLAVFRKPSLQRDGWSQIRPFGSYSWIAIFIWLGGSSGIIWLLIQHRSSTLQLSAFTTMELFLRQGIQEDDTGREMKLRWVLIAVALTTVALHTAYGGVLLSYISVQLETFTSLEQLLATDYTFTVNGGLLASQETVTGSVAEAYARHSGSKRQRPGVAKEEIMRGSHVLITQAWYVYEDLNEHYSHTERCSLGILRLPMQNTPLSTMVPKNSPAIKRMIDQQIIRFKEYGLNHLWLQRDGFYKRIGCSGRENTFDVVPLDCAMVAVYAFCLGVALSTVFILMEIKYNACSPSVCQSVGK